MPLLKTSAGRVHVEVTGNGPTLVLLHATLHDGRDYAPVLDTLAKDHRVITIDWPGHGQSDTPDQPVTAELLADVLEEIALAHDARDVRLIGNSVGGFAAARLAIRHPDRVAGLVLVDSGGFGASNPVTRTYCRAMGTPALTKRIMPGFVTRYMQPQTASDREITDRVRARTRTPEGVALAASLWRSFAEPAHDLRADAHRLTEPTLIVWGKRDKALPPSIGKATNKLLAHSQMHLLDTGHVVFSSDPSGFLAAVQPFLAGLPTITAANPS